MLLLESGVDVNSKDNLGTTVLHWATKKGHKAVVELLLERGADVNAQGGADGNALQAASCNGHRAVLGRHPPCT